MDRRKKLIGEGLQPFITFEEAETEKFGVPAVLGIDESLLWARRALRRAGQIHGQGVQQEQDAEVMDFMAEDMLQIEAAVLKSAEGQFTRDQGDDLAMFAAEIVDHLTEAELRELNSAVYKILDAED